MVVGVTAGRHGGGVCVLSTCKFESLPGRVWPDGRIKSSTIFTDIAQKVATLIMSVKINFSLNSLKITKIWASFGRKYHY